MRLGFLINEVLTGFRRNVTMTIAMILTTAISIGLFGGGLLVVRLADQSRDIYLDRVESQVFLTNDVSASDPTCDADPCKSLRQQIAYVGQTVHLFRGSVRDNIRYGKLGATEAEIIAAAKAAHAHDFIMSFPRGYDTPVGEHGLQLSGGQRQRIEIARALIKDAPIILLDEATASLDSESERHVQEALAELCKGRTTLVIAHRLSTIMHADCILVIENGAMIESGRHDELLRKSGRYASFYRLQLREQTPAAAE